MPLSLQPCNFFRQYRGLILLMMLLSFPLFGWSGWQCLKNSDNSVRQWLPDNNQETAAFDWFMERFQGDEIIVASWDDCHLDDPRLEQLAILLEDTSQVRLFDRVQTSTRLLQQLTSDRFRLSRTDAIERLTHSFIGQDGQTGCIVMALTEAGKQDRQAAVSTLRSLAEDTCGIDPATFRAAGPVIDNVALDTQSQQTIKQYMPLCIVLVFLAGTWALRSPVLTCYVFLIALYNAFLSLALLRWCGGKMNLVLIMLPTLVYVLSISSAVHLVNYYKEAVLRGGIPDAVATAVQDGWKPCLFAALTTAFGMASLGISQIAPVRDFGIYGAVAITASFFTTFLFLPAMLEYYTPKTPQRLPQSDSELLTPQPSLIATFSHWVTRDHRYVTVCCFLVLSACICGLFSTTSSVRILGNFSERHRIIEDYRWLEDHIGPMIPVEVIVTFANPQPSAALVKPDGSREVNPQLPKQLTTLQRLEYVRRVGKSLEQLDEVAGTLSAATFAPVIPQGGSLSDVIRRAAITQRLEYATNEFTSASLVSEAPDEQSWRISARMKALGDTDYGAFIQQLRKRADVVLVKPPQDAASGEPLDGVSVTITGVIPLVYRAQRQLLNDLAMSFATAFLIISVVTALVVRSFIGGCVAMIPNLFPVALVFGCMSLAGIPVRISAVLTASAALGIAVDDTLHFFTWVKRSIDSGHDRQGAVREAFHRCAPAMFQTTLINGVGMLVYAFTLFLPTRLFASLMFSLLAAALVGDLIFLPALLVGPFGRFLRHNLVQPRRRAA